MATRSVNKVILIGNLGKDAETQTTPSGVPVSRFAIATTRSWKDPGSNDWKEETNWTNVVLWRQENVAGYLTKGKQVYLEGRLQSRSYNDKEGRKIWITEVIANEVVLLSGKGMSSSNGSESPETRRSQNGNHAVRPKQDESADEYAALGITDDDIPF